MLDKFLEVAYEQTKQASLKQQVLTELKKLPDSELHKIASGEVKISCMGEDNWLDKFKCSPLYQDAVALEEQRLEADIADQQRRASEKSTSDERWAVRDSLNVKKRMLELDLRKSELSDEGPEPMSLPAPSAEEAVDKMASARGALLIESMRKEAKTSSVSDLRNAAKKSKGVWGRYKQLMKGDRSKAIRDFSDGRTGATRVTLGGKSGALFSGTTKGVDRRTKAWEKMQHVAQTEGNKSVAARAATAAAGVAGIGVGIDKLQGDKKKTAAITNLNDLNEFEKEALVAALRTAASALPGIAKFVGRTAKQQFGAARRGGTESMRKVLNRQTTVAKGRVSNFVNKSPGAAAALAGGAVGTAGLAGYAAG